MKGLLLKDWYLGKKTLIATLFIMIIFAVVTVISDNNYFMVYSVVLGGMIPVTLISYDEKSSWNTYSLTMPYTRAQIVSEKYIAAMIILAVSVISLGIGLVVRAEMSKAVNLDSVFATLGMLSVVGVITPSIMLPVIFKFGVDKGRFVYYIIIIALSSGIASIMEINKRVNFNFNTYMFIILSIVIPLMIMAVSWRLSIIFYEKRDF